MRKTKIVATLGPASSDPVTLRQLIKAGMNVARLNFSHGTHAEHAARIRLVRRIAGELKKPVAILLDLQGPKIRTGAVKNGKPIQLVRGKTVWITTQAVEGTPQRIATAYKQLPREVQKGGPILLDDGRIRLEVLRIHRSEVECRIVEGGWLKSNKGINLPGAKLSIPALTPKDRTDVRFGIENGVDFFALSFVRDPGDVAQLKNFLKKQKSEIPVIAKIEKEEAITCLDSILRVADGVMVARGDLGVEVSFEKVPVLQKKIIREATRLGGPVITATQMLESMIESPVPTRAEATDIANAIFDGTDALMLSAETASGKYPVASVQMMSRIACEAEGHYPNPLITLHHEKSEAVHAVVHAACQAAQEIGAKAILVFSMTGRTAALLSKFKPNKPIFALTPLEATYRRMALYWNVTPFVSPLGGNTDEMIRRGERLLLREGRLRKNDTVIVVAGSTLLEGATNMMKVLQL